MKHSLKTTIIIIFLTTSVCLGQKFSGGIIAGVNTSQVSGDDLGGFHKIGFYTGAFVKLPLNRNSSFQIELAFIQKGSREKIDENSQNINPYTLELDYVEVPIIYQWNQKPFSFQIGITGGILIKNEEGDGLNNFEGKPEFSPFEFGALLGINYMINKKLGFNWRICNSILAIREHSQGQSFRLNQGQYNTGLAFSFFYNFNGR